ncbi:hypothetical protein TrLO_g2498 [Triparma laevis f. longispina]|uniref:TFIIF beta subunit N-terminal domain-containing protein n=1 Tax=Triparma laevis f. longispina TaxID=1714387 RepID=A0A9W7C6K4_9STRA|nr:hypothetical protein TrLO_g2498 [Triparma laevis f. longispina]
MSSTTTSKSKDLESTTKVSIDKENPAQYWLVKVPKELIAAINDDSVTGSSTLGSITFTQTPKNPPSITFTLSPSLSSPSGTYDLTGLSKTYTKNGLSSVQTGVVKNDVKNKKRLIGEVSRAGSLIADEDTQRILLRKRVSEEARSKGVIKSTTDAEAKIEKEGRAGALDAFNEERERLKKIRLAEAAKKLSESSLDLSDQSSIRSKILSIYDEKDGRSFKEILALLNLENCKAKEEKIIKDALKGVARYSTKGKERGLYWLKGEFGGLGGFQEKGEE